MLKYPYSSIIVEFLPKNIIKTNYISLKEITTNNLVEMIMAVLSIEICPSCVEVFYVCI